MMKLGSLGMWHCLHDPTFSHFNTVTACDRHMDRQTCNDSKYLYCTSSMAWV